MKATEIEANVLRIVGRVAAGDPVEDARVELKSEWPDPIKAARRLAGHANAAAGEPILWIIGLDETRGVVGAEKEEVANWLPQVEQQFDQLAPGVYDLNVPVENKTLVALSVETERAPFVVKNPCRRHDPT